jgi:hypothetical protein
MGIYFRIIKEDVMKGKLLICIGIGTLVFMALFIGSPALFAESGSKDAKKGVVNTNTSSASDASAMKTEKATADEDDKIDKEIEKAIKESDASAEQEWEAKGPHGRKHWWKRHHRCKKCVWYCNSRFDYSRRLARRCIWRHCSFYCGW